MQTIVGKPSLFQALLHPFNLFLFNEWCEFLGNFDINFLMLRKSVIKKLILLTIKQSGQNFTLTQTAQNNSNENASS